MYNYNSIKSYMIRAPFLFTISHDNSEKRDITAQHIADILTQNKYVKNGEISRVSAYDTESLTIPAMKLNLKSVFNTRRASVILLDDIGHFFDYSCSSTFIGLMLDGMRVAVQKRVGVILLDTPENMNKLFNIVNMTNIVPESNMIDSETCERDAKRDYMNQQVKYKNSKAALGTLINAWTSSAQKSSKQASARVQYILDELANVKNKPNKLDNGLWDLIDELSK